MALLTLADQHITNRSSGDICDICQPLFDKTKINYFYFVRAFDNGECSVLLSDKNWIHHKLQHEYKIVPPAPNSLISDKFCYFIQEQGNYQQAMHDFKNVFQQFFPFAMVERHDGYFDISVFATSENEKSFINFYLNNLDVLHKFNSYFKDKATNLISRVQQDRLSLPTHMQTDLKKSIPLIQNNISIKKQLEQLLDNKINLNNKTDIKLSKRETECLTYLAKGRSAKEIGAFLHISPRTVEFHLDQIKNKIGRNRKSDLLNYFEENYG